MNLHKEQESTKGRTQSNVLRPDTNDSAHEFFGSHLTELDRIIENALQEDIAAGDITATSIVPADQECTADVVLKEAATVAGLLLFSRVISKCDQGAQFEAFVNEGQVIPAGKIPYTVARVTGKARAVLSAERTALNLMQRMSGIATMTRKFTELAEPLRIEILDTRKTTPGLRLVEKWAVTLGGGTNHRFGLYDKILIKDNHIAIANGITNAVNLARRGNPGMPVEVEVTNIDQLKEALSLSVEHIMLDNMSPTQIKESVALIAGRAYIEVSGGVRLDNLKQYLIEGVSGISIGALTHSVKNIDISLEF